MKEFLNEIAPYESRILDGDCFGKMCRGELPLETFRHVMLDFYPLVESFPKYMALILSWIPMENNDKSNIARFDSMVKRGGSEGSPLLFLRSNF